MGKWYLKSYSEVFTEMFGLARMILTGPPKWIINKWKGWRLGKLD